MATPIPLTAGFIVVDTTTAKTFQLPLSTDIVGRSITVKDRTGNAGTNNITIQTQGGDTLEGGETSYKITQPYGSVTFVSRVGQWLLEGGTEELNVSTINALNVSTGSIQTSTITIVDIQNPGNFGTIRYGVAGLEYLTANNHSFLNQDATNTQVISAKELSLFAVGNDFYSYSLTAGYLYTSTISSLVLANAFAGVISPLYLSSVFLGNFGGTIYGELTTDSTASDIYWNGSSLTQGGGGGGGITTAQLVSTVQNFQTDFKTQKISSGLIELSTVNLLDTYTSLVNYLTVSSGTLLLNGGFITGSGGSAVSQLIAGSNITLNPPGGTGAVTINNSINPTGLVSTANLSGLLSTGSILGLVSTPNLSNLVSTSFLDTTLVSTVRNLGNFYLSTVPAYLSALTVSTGSLQASTIILFDTANPATTFGIIQYGLSGLQYLTANTHSFLNQDATNTQAISAKELSLFAIGTDTYSYILTSGNLFTSTVSSVVLIDGPTAKTAPLYLSSVFLGNNGGTIYGQLTTDSTASDIYWNGSSLTQGGVTTAELVSTTGGLQTNFIGQQATLSSLYLNLDPFNAPSWDSNVPIAGFDPEPNPLALDVYGSVRILKNLYIGSTTTKIGTGGIQTANLIVSSIQALSEVSTANILASTINLIDVNTAVPQTLAVSSGTLTLNGQGITGGGGGTPTDWALYPALSTVVLDSVSPKIVNPSGTFATFETQNLTVIDSNSNYGSVAVGNINLKTSQNPGQYILENSQFVTGTISTLSLAYYDVNPPFITQNTGSLYLSSIYFGNYGGSVAGELTTDDTATNIYWKGTQLNGGGGGVTTGELVSTVVDFQTDFKTLKISSGFIELSTVNLLDTYTSAINYLTVSTGTLLLNGGYITGSGGSAVSQLLAGTNISLTPAGGTGIVTINNTINPTGLVSTPNLNNLVSTSFFETRLVSTVINLGSLGYVSTASLLNLVSTGFFDTRLVSTVVNLGSLGYVSTASLTSTVAGLGRNYISTPSLVSTVAGLGQRYISSFSSFSTSIATLFTASNAIFSSLTATNATMCNITVSTITFNTGDGFIDFPDIRALSMSTFIVNACTINAGFLVSTQVLNVSSIIGVSFLTLANVISTTANFVSTASLTSTVAGLGQAGYVSTGSLVSTYSGIIALGLLSTPSLTSTVAGLGQAGYVSTGSLVSTYSGIIALGFLSTASLVSTVRGLGQAGYVSTLSNVNNVSANQFVASSFYATLAGPTTLVLYDI